MRKDDLIDAIGKIDDEVLEETSRMTNEKDKKRKKTFWLLVPALALVLAFFIQTNKPEDNLVLAQADYPKLSQYPQEADEWNDEVEKQYQAWEKDQEDLASQASKVDYSAYQAFFEKINREVLKDLGHENRTYSPLNIYMGTSMLAEVTGGTSRQEVLDLLSTQDMDKLRDNAKAIWLDNYQDDGRYTSLMANSFWLREGDDDYKQESLSNLATYYYASAFRGKMGSQGYNKAFRDWINDNTKGLLKGASDQLELSPETVLALVSTIYFKDAWRDGFQDQFNTREDFYSPQGPVQVDFMNQTLDGPAYFGDSFIASPLFYRDSGAMVFFKPTEGKTLEDVLVSPDFQALLFNPETFNHQKQLMINYKIPKFEVEANLDLVGTMQNLGLEQVFDTEKSDFSNLKDRHEGLALTSFQHAAKVMIDEEGTEAAAFTVMMVEECMAPWEDLEQLDFFLDQPFIFVITNASGTPTFVGVVNNPHP